MNLNVSDYKIQNEISFCIIFDIPRNFSVTKSENIAFLPQTSEFLHISNIKSNNYRNSCFDLNIISNKNINDKKSGDKILNEREIQLKNKNNIFSHLKHYLACCCISLCLFSLFDNF